jgi:hypothetical protein
MKIVKNWGAEKESFQGQVLLQWRRHAEYCNILSLDLEVIGFMKERGTRVPKARMRKTRRLPG